MVWKGQAGADGTSPLGASPSSAHGAEAQQNWEPRKNRLCGRSAGSPGSAWKVEMDKEATTEFLSSFWDWSMPLAKRKKLSSSSSQSIIPLLWLLPSVEAFTSAHVMDASSTGKLSLEGEKEKKVFSYVFWCRAQWSISDARVQIIVLLLCLFLWITKLPINRLVGEQWFCMLNSVIASSHWDCVLSELDSWKIHILVIKLDFIYKYWLRGFPSQKLWFLFLSWWT